MPVPYLKSRPPVIAIDVGRQLFVDDFLIDSTTLVRHFHAAEIHESSPVLKPDKPWEAKGEKATHPAHAMPYSDGVWYDSTDELFKMWYMAGYCQSTCYATSRDGIHWKKPSLDVVPGTNIVHAGTRDSTTVWLDHDEKDPQRRFKMMRRDQGTRRHTIHFSADGIHWGDGLLASRAPDRTTFFYNPFRRVWVMNVRGTSLWESAETAYDGYKPSFTEGQRLGTVRHRRYREGPDLLEAARSWPDSANLKYLHDPQMWVWADRLDQPRSDIGGIPELYHLDVIAYESAMLGLFSIWKGHPKDYPARDKICDLYVGFSRDGFHWDRTSRKPLVAVSKNPDDWNYGNIQPVGGCCLIVGDKLHIYVSGRMTYDVSKHPGFCSTGLLTMRRDGFASMDAGEEEEFLTTPPVMFSGSHLFVNVDNPKGKLTAEMVDENGAALAPFTRGNCDVVSVDSTKQEVRWKDAKDLSSLAGQPVRFRFHLTNGRLYSFWLSPSSSGASNGYVGAGGPGFTEVRDSNSAKQ